MDERGGAPIIHKRKPKSGLYQGEYNTDGIPVCECAEPREYLFTNPANGVHHYGRGPDCRSDGEDSLCYITFWEYCVMALTVVNWNVEWAKPRGWKIRPEILRRIGRHSPEVVCLTEAYMGFLADGGHAISSQEDYGYAITADKRKVLLWSKEPWKQVDDLGSEALPPGRFVSGTTNTSLGDITVVGVCIPWPGSRTEKHRELERKGRWEDHEQYLCHLELILRDMLIGAHGNRLMVMGDFNQVMGPGRGLHAPDSLHARLKKAFPPGMTIVSSQLEFKGRGAIDHIALSEDLAVESIDAISDEYGGAKLSDHFGVVAKLRESQTVCSN